MTFIRLLCLWLALRLSHAAILTLSPSSAHLVRRVALPSLSPGYHSVSIPFPSVYSDNIVVRGVGACEVTGYVIDDVSSEANETMRHRELEQRLEQYLRETQLQLDLLRTQSSHRSAHLDMLLKYLKSNSTSLGSFALLASASDEILVEISSLSQQIEALRSISAEISSSLKDLRERFIYSPPSLPLPTYLPRHRITFSPTIQRKAQVSVFVYAATCSLEIKYVLKASWSASYDILLYSDKPADIVMYAIVKQSSGEDWECENDCVLSTISPSIATMSTPTPLSLYFTRDHTAHHHHSSQTAAHYAPRSLSYNLPRGLRINSTSDPLQVLLSRLPTAVAIFTDVSLSAAPKLMALFSNHSFSLPATARVYLDDIYMGTHYVDHTTLSLEIAANHAIQVEYPQPSVLTLYPGLQAKPIVHSKQYRVLSRMRTSHTLVMHDISHTGVYGDVKVHMTYPVAPVAVDLRNVNAQLVHIMSTREHPFPQQRVYTDIYSNKVLYVNLLAPNTDYHFVVHATQITNSDASISVRLIMGVTVAIWLALVATLTRRLWLKRVRLLLLKCRYCVKSEAVPCCKDDEKLHDV